MAWTMASFWIAIVVDARLFFQIGDGRFNICALKGLKAVFLQQPGQAFLMPSSAK